MSKITFDDGGAIWLDGKWRIGKWEALGDGYKANFTPKKGMVRILNFPSKRAMIAAVEEFWR